MTRRVVITGIGAVNSIGASSREFWRNLLTGVSGAAPISSRYDIALRQNVGCEVRRAFSAEGIAGIGRATQLAIAAAEDAIADSGLSASDVERADISVGTTMGEPGMIEDRNGEACFQADAISAGVALHLHSHGHNTTWQTACAAGNYAIDSGWRRIAAGLGNIALTGGSDAFSRTAFIGFARVGALAPDVCRPFDLNRKGLLLGEGAGMLVLEELEQAKRRSAKIYAEVLACGFSCDAFHITQPHPKADGAVIAMGRALKQANVDPETVDYVSAHGTGTKFNDLAEAVAVKRVFGGRRVPVTSIKALIGHTMGSASAIEAVACCLAIQERVIPPTWNYQETDPACDLDVVPNCPREADLNIVISNSYAFGGSNSCLVLRKY
jgi:3-oxoacyl-[acyl-carrier-protein] synthase II